MPFFQNDDPALVEVLRRIAEAYRPIKVYLFGSRARGEAGPDSDYDLLAIVPDDAEPERRRGKLACMALRGTGLPVDVIVWTEGNFRERSRVVCSLPATVLREGKIVYAA